MNEYRGYPYPLRSSGIKGLAGEARAQSREQASYRQNLAGVVLSESKKTVQHTANLYGYGLAGVCQGDKAGLLGNVGGWFPEWECRGLDDMS